MANRAYFFKTSFQVIADLGEGWTLVCTEGGPAVCGHEELSALEPSDLDHCGMVAVKLKAIRAYREWSWPKIAQQHKENPNG